jgi:hypothetical protein
MHVRSAVTSIAADYRHEIRECTQWAVVCYPQVFRGVVWRISSRTRQTLQESSAGLVTGIQSLATHACMQLDGTKIVGLLQKFLANPGTRRPLSADHFSVPRGTVFSTCISNYSPVRKKGGDMSFGAYSHFHELCDFVTNLVGYSRENRSSLNHRFRDHVTLGTCKWSSVVPALNRSSLNHHFKDHVTLGLCTWSSPVPAWIF